MVTQSVTMKKFALVFLSFVLVLTVVEPTSKLRLFDGPNYRQLIFNEELGEDCVNIPQINNRASSVDTAGTCVYLYEHWDCNGRRVRVEPGSRNHDNLASLNFDNVASSVRACCPQIQENSDSCCNRGTNNSSLPFFLQTAKLRLYDGENYQDLIYEGVPTEECTNIIDEGNRASSLDTLGTCVYLYDKWNCVGRRIKVQPGFPNQNNLDGLSFNNAVLSFRACCEQDNRNRTVDL